MVYDAKSNDSSDETSYSSNDNNLSNKESLNKIEGYKIK